MNNIEKNALRIAETEEQEHKESWIDINGYNGLYQISSKGNIKSIDKYIRCRGNKHRLIKGKVLKPVLSGLGGKYYAITLYNDGELASKLIHRLVAEHFVIKGNDLQNEVNHIDGNKLNNHYENLEWCTHSENITHSYRVLKNRPTMLGRVGKLNKTSVPIKIINRTTGESMMFESQRRASLFLGVAQCNISRYLSGKRNSKQYIIQNAQEEQ